jgi:ribonuclease R
LDENLQVVDFKPYPIYESNKLIEEFMILANESVSRKFSKIPFLYRIHEKPKHEDIERLKKILDIFGVHFKFVNYDTKEFADLIELVKTHKEKHILEKLILRTLQKAIYSDKNLGHFGLGLDYYSHFTSPIRRYPDYQIHRLIKQKLH